MMTETVSDDVSNDIDVDESMILSLLSVNEGEGDGGDGNIYNNTNAEKEVLKFNLIEKDGGDDVDCDDDNGGPTRPDVRACRKYNRLTHYYTYPLIRFMLLIGICSWTNVAAFPIHPIELKSIQMKSSYRHAHCVTHLKSSLPRDDYSSSSFTESDSGLFVPNDYLCNADNDARIAALLHTESKSGISYQDVLEGIDHLFPPDGLDERTALSRKDGYWPFIQTGDEPPKEYVYGEFDVLFFAQVLDRACEIWWSSSNSNIYNNNNKAWDDMVFCDLGSGTGRLVLAAAALHRWKLCRGIELLSGIHDAAEANLELCRVASDDSSLGTETLSLTAAASSELDSAATEGANSFAKWQAAYMEQYRNSIPNNDDWLKQLSNSLDDDENSEEEDFLGADLYNIESGSDNFDDSGDFNAQETVDTDSLGDIPPVPKESKKEKVVYPENNGKYALSLMSDESRPLRLSPIELSCGSFDDPYEYFGDSDCVFVFSTAMPSNVIEMISKAVGRQCKPGSIVITSEYPLPLEGYIPPMQDDPAMPYGYYRLELVEELTGDCWCTGGISTVFFHRVVESLREVEYDGENYRRVKPVQVTEESAIDKAKEESIRVARALDSWGILPDDQK